MSGGHLITQLLVSTVVVFLFIGSLLGLALGLGLILRSAAIVSFMRGMNRWVSTRQALKGLEVQVHVAQAAASARWFGAVLVALGAYTAVVLIVAVDVNGIAAMLKVNSRYSLAAIGIHAAKLVLVLGSLMAIATGVMLLFFPQAWRNVEARANRWYSTGNLEGSEDRVYLSLERIVEAFPRSSGVVLLAMSLVTTIFSGMMVFR